jgi:DNA-binding CsgD family transcriptional regulator
MGTSSRGIRREIARVELAAAEVSSVADLAAAPLEHLTRAVGASTSMLFRFDVAGPEILGGSLKQAMADYREEHFANDAIHRASFRVRHVVTPVILHEWSALDWREHRRGLAYNEFYRRADVEYLLCVHLDEEESGAFGQTGIVLARAASEEPFDRKELDIASHAARALRLAMRRARRVEQLARESESARAILGDRALMTIRPDARVHWASSAAARIGAAWIGPHGWLEEPLRTAVRRLARIAREVGDALGTPIEIELCALPEITAELWLARDDRGHPLIAIELKHAENAPAKTDAQKLAARYGLTAAETRVLYALGDALSNREIAARLGVSIETARTHVARVLSKLGVRSRVEAAILLTRNALARDD